MRLEVPGDADHPQLTDVSFVICNLGYEVEQFVAPGTSCKQGTPGVMIDEIVPEIATATRVFSQAPPVDPVTFASVPAATPASSTYA